MTGKQQTVGWLALGLVVANLLDGGLRDALSSLTSKANSGGAGPGGIFQGHGGGVGPHGLIPTNPFPFPGNPTMPDIPAVPQGPITGIPFSPISSTGGTNLHGLPPLQTHQAATLYA